MNRLQQYENSKNVVEGRQFLYEDWEASGIEKELKSYTDNGYLEVYRSDAWKLYYPELRKDEKDLGFYTTKYKRASNKYILPKGAKLRLFRPLGFDLSFGYSNIYITEGEKKAIAGISRGIPTLAISGCWNFRQDKDLIDDLKEVVRICLQKKIKITLLSDSDYFLNNSIKKAWFEFVKELRRCKVDVCLKVIPLINKEFIKMGLDDLLKMIPTETEKDELLEYIEAIDTEEIGDKNILEFMNIPETPSIKVPESLEVFRGAGINRFNEGSLVIINGATNIGKTWLFVRMGDSFAQDGHRCLFISLEMGLPEIVNRYKKIYESKIFPDYLKNLIVIADLEPHLSEIERRIYNNDAKVIFVDYLQYIRPEGDIEQRMTDYTYIDYKMQLLKKMARDLGVVIFVVSSMSRESIKNNIDDKTNMLGISGKGSGGIEYGADFVFNLVPYMVEVSNENKSSKKAKKREPESINNIKTLIAQMSKNRQYAFCSDCYKVYFDANDSILNFKYNSEFINEED